MGSKLVGCGSAVPKLQISNNDLEKIVETSDEWISVRTGIRNRRVLSGASLSDDLRPYVSYLFSLILTGDETLTGLATDAAKRALQMAQVTPEDVDIVIMCTSTPENLFGDAARVCSQNFTSECCLV